MPAEIGGRQGRAYLDYAATAPLDMDIVREALAEACWGNANALYAEGQQAKRQLEQARRRMARALHAHAPSEIVFTSGGSESDNMALRGLPRPVSGARHTHVVVSAIEHDAVLNAADSLKGIGYKVDRVSPGGSGIVEPDALEGLLSRIEQAGDATSLVAVQAVNNEIGTIQPIEDLARIAHRHDALFFTDAVQALGKVDIDLEASGTDAAAFSAHKVGAMKGIGALYLRRGTRCRPLVYGGGQESGLRSGTQNVPGALMFAAATEAAVEDRQAVWDRVAGFRRQILDVVEHGEFAHAIEPTLPECDSRVPHILSFVVDGLEGETLVLRADNLDVAVSAGSACSSGSLEPSHVLMAIGVPRDRAFGSLRLSFGARTGQDDIDAFLEALPEMLR